MTDAPAAATRGVATTDDLVLTERRGPVALLTLNRPAKLNAWSNALEDRYFDLLAEADDDPQVRAVVVTGAGRGFCSGADLDDLRHVADASDDDLMRPRPRDFPLRVRTPLVAAIRGPVAGLGLVEALYCDVRFGDPTARFTTAFARRGLIAEYGISWLLPRSWATAAPRTCSCRAVWSTRTRPTGSACSTISSPPATSSTPPSPTRPTSPRTARRGRWRRSSSSCATTPTGPTRTRSPPRTA